MALRFVSGNKGKIRELQNALPQFQVFALENEVDETEPTFGGNALLKARSISLEEGEIVVADDSGLEVHALQGAPGVHSARYAGPEKDDQRNMDKLLRELQGKDDRSAQFRTILALITNGREYLFEGIVRGTIIAEKRGKNGFGYDPVFVPEGYDQTFAEMTIEEKNQISHRARALQKLVDFLKDHKST